MSNPNTIQGVAPSTYYEGLMHLPVGGASLTASLQYIYDGLGNATTIQVSTGGTTIANPTLSGTVTLGTVSSGTWNGNTISVTYGGTGVTSTTAYAVLCGGTTSTGALQPIASVGTSGQVLTSNGAGALPTFQTVSSGPLVYLGQLNSGNSWASTSILSGYNSYYLIFNNIYVNNSSTQISVQLYSGGVYNSLTGNGIAAGTSSTNGSLTNGSQASPCLNATATLTLNNSANNGNVIYGSGLMSLIGSSLSKFVCFGGSDFNSTTATGLQLVASSGSFNSYGYVSVFGIKNS